MVRKVKEKAVPPKRDLLVFPETIFGQPPSQLSIPNIRRILHLSNQRPKPRELKSNLLTRLAELEAKKPLYEVQTISQLLRLGSPITKQSIQDGLQAEEEEDIEVDEEELKQKPDQTCAICVQTSEARNFHQGKMSQFCMHHEKPVCILCIKNDIARQIRFADWVRLSCCYCGMPLPPNFVRKYIAPERLEAYTNYIQTHPIRKHPFFMGCSAPACSSGQIHTGGKRSPKMECSKCSAVTCFKHRVPWHEGKTCAEFEFPDPGLKGKRLVEWKKDERSRKKIKKDTKPCPKCKVPIEKDGGCDHMYCTRCKENWCWSTAKGHE